MGGGDRIMLIYWNHFAPLRIICWDNNTSIFWFAKALGAKELSSFLIPNMLCRLLSSDKFWLSNLLSGLSCQNLWPLFGIKICCYRLMSEHQTIWLVRLWLGMNKYEPYRGRLGRKNACDTSMPTFCVCVCVIYFQTFYADGIICLKKTKKTITHLKWRKRIIWASLLLPGGVCLFKTGSNVLMPWCI